MRIKHADTNQTRSRLDQEHQTRIERECTPQRETCDVSHHEPLVLGSFRYKPLDMQREMRPSSSLCPSLPLSFSHTDSDSLPRTCALSSSDRTPRKRRTETDRQRNRGRDSERDREGKRDYSISPTPYSIPTYTCLDASSAESTSLAYTLPVQGTQTAHDTSPHPPTHSAHIHSTPTDPRFTPTHSSAYFSAILSSPPIPRPPTPIQPPPPPPPISRSYPPTPPVILDSDSHVALSQWEREVVTASNGGGGKGDIAGVAGGQVSGGNRSNGSRSLVDLINNLYDEY